MTVIQILNAMFTICLLTLLVRISKAQQVLSKFLMSFNLPSPNVSVDNSALTVSIILYNEISLHNCPITEWQIND